MTAEPRPWDQLEEETPKAYAAFCVFRDLGPARLLCEAIRIHYSGRSCQRHVNDWKRIYRWDERVRAYDQHCQRLAEEATAAAVAAEKAKLEAERIEAKRQRVETARLAVSKARAALEATPADQIPAGTIPQLLKVGADLARLEDGEATEMIKGEADLVVKVLRGVSMDDL